MVSGLVRDSTQPNPSLTRKGQRQALTACCAVARGFDDGGYCRSAYRTAVDPAHRNDYFGFRLALAL